MGYFKSLLTGMFIFVIIKTMVVLIPCFSSFYYMFYKVSSIAVTVKVKTLV